MNAPAKAGLPSLPLKDPKLFREQCYIDGEWVGSQKTFPVNNPATGAVLGTVPDLGAERNPARHRGGRARPGRRGARRPPRSARRSCASGTTS